MIYAFLLDGIITKYLFITPLFTLLTLLFIYRNENRYAITLIIGILYDLLYTDTLFLNAFIFLLILLLIEKIFKYIKYNFLNVLLVSILIIVIYRISIYLILCLIGYLYFDYVDLLFGTIYSLINIIYVIALYFGLKYYEYSK